MEAAWRLLRWSDMGRRSGPAAPFLGVPPGDPEHQHADTQSFIVRTTPVCLQAVGKQHGSAHVTKYYKAVNTHSVRPWRPRSHT